MPLQTFENLPCERKKKIINVCLEEFSHHDFKSASLSKIIKTLGIAKGSFYRYFENKTALYHYLFQFTQDLLITSYKTQLTDPAISFYDAWIEYNLKTMELSQEYPFCINFINKAAEDRIIDIFKMNETERNTLRLPVIRKIIEIHQKRGDIRSDMDTDLLALFLHYARKTFQQYLYQKFPEYQGLNQKKPLTELFSMATIKAELNEYIKLIKSALYPGDAKGEEDEHNN